MWFVEELLRQRRDDEISLLFIPLLSFYVIKREHLFIYTKLNSNGSLNILKVMCFWILFTTVILFYFFIGSMMISLRPIVQLLYFLYFYFYFSTPLKLELKKSINLNLFERCLIHMNLLHIRKIFALDLECNPCIFYLLSFSLFLCSFCLQVSINTYKQSDKARSFLALLLYLSFCEN
jgi:hypothetical protein